MKPDLDAAISFQRKLWPEGLWTLTSIAPDKSGIETKSFEAANEHVALTWLAKWAGSRNIYFALNPLLKMMNTKAGKVDVAAGAFLHVDCDPRAGEDLAAERERILHLLTDNRPAHIPEPTIIIDSGGGFQAIWKLSEPVPINGDVTAAEAFELYNKGLERSLGGDNCHNIDRILRLPGTTNIPDERKKRKGRESAPAKLVQFKSELVYPLSAFTPAPEKQESAGAPVEAKVVPVDVAVLPVTDDIKRLVREGPREGEYTSRSEALFAVCCALVAADCDDDTIFSVITIPTLKISESVLDKKNSHRYAIRQIERAREAAADPDIAAFNDRYAVALFGSKASVLRFVKRKLYDDDEHEVPDFVGVDSFRLYTADKKTKTDDGAVATHKLWLAHHNRRTYEDVLFAPGEDPELEGRDHPRLNLWRGWGVEPAPGPWPTDELPPLMEHLMRDGLAVGDEESFCYLDAWSAWAFQHPDQRPEVAPVFRGRKGVGKSTFGVALCRLFGAHGLQISDHKHLVGSFNAHMMQCALLFADEAMWPGDKEGEGQLKRLITERTLLIERKGFDAFQAPNHVHLIISGNADWVVPASGDERRYAVFDVSDHLKGDMAFWRELHEEMAAGGLAHMLHRWLALDLMGWHPRDSVPQTKALQRQKEISRRGVDVLVEDIANSGRLPWNLDHRHVALTTGEEDGRGFWHYAKATVPDLRNWPARRVMRALRDDYECARWKSDLQRGVEFPSPKRLRELFEKKHGPVDWDSEAIEEWGRWE